MANIKQETTDSKQLAAGGGWQTLLKATYQLKQVHLSHLEHIAVLICISPET